MKVLDAPRRDSAAVGFALLAAGSLALIVIAAVADMRDVARSVLATVAFCGYWYFADRAMVLWQGRGQPSLHRPAWRRRFLRDPHR